MAGSGRRTFTPGEVLTASNVMNYLMDQSVMNFAGTAARGSAIGTAVSEGMVSYLADTDAVQVYNGSVWKPIGTVLQVVTATSNALTVNSTSSFVDTGLTATITPSSTTSKILVLADQNGVFKSASNAGNWALLTLVRDTTSITGSYGPYTGTALNLSVGSVSFNYLDSPASTSALTYKVRIANDFNGANVQVNYGGCTSGITLMEIAA